MASKPFLNIELGEGFVSKTRSLDKTIRGALLAALGVDESRKGDGEIGPATLRVASKFGVRMTPSFESIMRRTRDELRDETPRSKGALKQGPHLADGWRVRVRTDSNGSRFFEVDNKDPRAEKLLAIFEYGTKKNYKIEAKDPDNPLFFYWEKVNKVVRFRKVTHPGVNQYVGYIARARRRLRARSTKALLRLEQRWIKNVGIS